MLPFLRAPARLCWAILGCLLLVGCGPGQPSANVPEVGAAAEGKVADNPAKSIKAVGAQAGAAAAAVSPEKWLTAYAAALKLPEAKDVPQKGEATAFSAWIIRYPSAEETKLLRELRGASEASRLAVLEACLKAGAISSEIPLPIEYFAHAAVGSSEELRRKVWAGLLQPRLAAKQPQSSEREAALRMVIELELESEQPGLAAEAVAYVVQFRPKITDRHDLGQAAASLPFMTTIYRIMRAAAEEERLGIWASLVKPQLPPGLDPVQVLKNEGEARLKQMLTGESFHRNLESYLQEAEREHSNVSPADILKSLAENPNLPADEVLAKLSGGNTMLFGPEDWRKVLPLLVNAFQETRDPAKKRDAMVRIAIRSEGLSMEDRKTMLVAIRDLQARQRYDGDFEYCAGQLVEKAPPEQGAELIALIAELNRDKPMISWQSVKPVSISAEKRKDVIRQLTGMLAQQDASAMSLAVALADELPDDDREKLQAFLVKKLQELGGEAEPPPADQHAARQFLLDCLARSKKLPSARAEELLTLSQSWQNPPPSFSPPRTPQWRSGRFLDNESTQALLLRQASPEMRGKAMAELIAQLPARPMGVSSQTDTSVAATLAELSPILTPAEADQACAALCKQLIADYSTHRRTPALVSKFLLARPAEERSRHMNALAAAILKGVFRPNSHPSERDEGVLFIKSACESFPAAEATSVYLAAVQTELAKKEGTLDGQLLASLAKRVPRADQPKAGAATLQMALANQDENNKFAWYLGSLAEMPHALTAKQLEDLMLAILTKMAIGPMEDPRAHSPDGDLIMQRMSPLFKLLAPRLDKESAGRVLDRAVEIMESYVKDAKPDSYQSFVGPQANCPHLMRAITALPLEIPPDKMQRIARAHSRYFLGVHPAARDREYYEFSPMKGNLPAGEGLALYTEIVNLIPQTGRQVDDVAASMYLLFLAPRLAEKDALTAFDRTMKLLDLPPKPGEKKGPFPEERIEKNAFGWLSQAAGKCGERLTPAQAELAIDKLAALLDKEQDAQGKSQLKWAMGGPLKALAKGGLEKLRARLDALGDKVDPGQRALALQSVAAPSDSKALEAFVDDLLAKTRPIDVANAGDPRRGPPQAFQSLGSLLSTLPLEQKIQLSDTLTRSGKATSREMLLLTMSPAKEPFPADKQIELLQEPDRVGGRRNVVVRANIRPPAPQFFASVWNIYRGISIQPPEASADSSGPRPPQ